MNSRPDRVADHWPGREASDPITRRSFLVAAGLGLGAALAGCGGKSSAINVDKPKSQSSGGLNLLSSSGEIPVGPDRRVAMVMADNGGTFISPKGAVTVGFGSEQGKVTGPTIEAGVHTDATGAPPYITIRRDFLQIGSLWATVKANGLKASIPLNVVDHLPGPGIGDKVPVIATPTAADHQGVEPICTHDPPCALHQVSLDHALASGQPVVVLFATPKYCQTATCGPVLDTLLGAMGPTQSKAQFIHAEIYKAPTPTTDISSLPLAPVVQDFRLESEPSLFLLKPDGTVQDRIEGLFGTAECAAALQALTG